MSSASKRRRAKSRAAFGAPGFNMGRSQLSAVEYRESAEFCEMLVREVLPNRDRPPTVREKWFRRLRFSGGWFQKPPTGAGDAPVEEVGYTLGCILNGLQNAARARRNTQATDTERDFSLST